MPKPELEFHSIEDVKWTRCEGKVPTLYEKILARDPQTGTVTRLLKFEPGTDTTPNGTLRHDFWEEIYILEGSLFDKVLNRRFSKGMYACRPPGMPHGPWISEEGCITFEVRYSTK
ncbi:cupin domain-containing protein [Thermoplasmatales archaeon AK]|nr:cupin domain-containing protein [Thermoplasmatales archaeon AK]